MAFVPRGPVMIRQPRPRTNALWRNWAGPGIFFGLVMALMGLVITVLEIARAFIGVDNRGCSINQEFYNFYQNTLQETFPGLLTLSNGILFGLVLIAAGILGIISGRRRSYSSIVAFLVASLVSFFLMIYLIAYYSTVVRWFNDEAACNESFGQTRSTRVNHFIRIGRALLAFAIFGLLSTLPAILACLVAISAWSRKGRARTNVRPRFMPAPYGRIVVPGVPPVFR
ncbi:hypothetical protein GJ496_000445 [Pomphorhynchus laevis]|nr:hypothetical protein GJ496_000445 [Pomphorhynchus laevis]